MLYGLLSTSILLLAIVWMIPVGTGDFSAWSCAIVYPIAFAVCVTMPECQEYFDKN